MYTLNFDQPYWLLSQLIGKLRTPFRVRKTLIGLKVQLGTEVTMSSCPGRTKSPISVLVLVAEDGNWRTLSSLEEQKSN